MGKFEKMPDQQINGAYDRMLKGDVKYRFVIDMPACGTFISRGKIVSMLPVSRFHASDRRHKIRILCRF